MIRCCSSVAVRVRYPVKMKQENVTFDMRKKEKSKGKESGQVSFCQLFRFASKSDVALMILSTLAAVASSAADSIFTLLYADLVDTLVNNERRAISHFNTTERLPFRISMI